MFISIHLFTLGCDTTSKFGTKRAAYQTAIDIRYGLFCSFGKEMITCGTIAPLQSQWALNLKILATSAMRTDSLFHRSRITLQDQNHFQSHAFV